MRRRWNSSFFALVVVLLWLAIATVGSTSSQVPVQRSLDKSLIGAVIKGDVAAVELLLEQGASPDAREIKITKPNATKNLPGGTTYLGNTALILAILGRFEDVARLLISRDASVNLVGWANYTPLFEAVRTSNAALVALLLSKGADPNHRNSSGNTPIVFAGNGGNVEIVKALLDAGADINGGAGWTPLMQAAYGNRTEVVKLLLERGADPNFHRPPDMSPLECAEAQFGDESATILRKAGAVATSSDKRVRERNALYAKWDREREETLKAKAAKYADASQLTDDDRAVIVAVMEDLAAYRGKGFLRIGEKGPRLILLDETRGNISEGYDDQINSELDISRALQFTLEMRRHMFNRNFKSVSLAGLEFADPDILLRKRSVIPTSQYGSLGDLALVRGWVQVYLPGLNETRDKAVVRFRFGPTSHGAAGTCFLEKLDGAWKVIWRDFAFYV